MAEHTTVVNKNDDNSQFAAHSMEPGYILQFNEVEILASGDNRVSRELLESWSSGPQCINKLLKSWFSAPQSIKKGHFHTAF
ncbi:unnamed protein product [Dibothriocephalus latus]|uniref:Uncharacterized protein n=1 Tax=Dibothriocephalus latus TaxID=60516 RepID=A0A3P7N2E8_DIBLA|nr:unnamed protein product [Dibothriocephalus latus]